VEGFFKIRVGFAIRHSWGEYYRFIASNDNPFLQVKSQRSRQHRFFDITAQSHHVIARATVAHANNVLLDKKLTLHINFAPTEPGFRSHSSGYINKL